MSQTDYFDSSALVKRYMAEIGSAWVIGRYQEADRIMATADFSRVEIAAAFAAKLRGHFITQADYDRAREVLTADGRNRYHLLPVTSERVDEAVDLTTRHKLRGYDAIHLVCALYLNRALMTNSLPALTFVAADTALLTAAQVEGLTTVNPNDQPD